MESDRPLSARSSSFSLLSASVEWFPFACLGGPWGGSRWGTALSDAHRHARALLQPVVVEVPGAPWKREQEPTSSYGWFPASTVPFRRGGGQTVKGSCTAVTSLERGMGSLALRGKSLLQVEI